MAIGKVTRNFQITIPASIRKALRISVGSIVDFDLKEGEVIMKPKEMIDKDQSWFWTDEWQKGEKEVDESRRKKDTTSFDDVDEMKKHFEK